MKTLDINLDTWLDTAWNDHADHAAAVASRLPQALPLVLDDDGAMRVAALAHHVFGEHLGQWAAGLDYLRQLNGRGVRGPAAALSLARCMASLNLAASQIDERATMTTSDQCRVSAMAAASLAAFDSTRAAQLLNEAMASAHELPDADPGVRAVAANSNGIAATLAELTPLQPAQRDLMLQTADVARSHWERAGTWLEIERAEYRLALCWLAAGDATMALRHAQNCQAIVTANGAVPLEVFFAAEALHRAALALKDAHGQAAARSTAQQSFDALEAADQAWCRTTLDKINVVRSDE